METRSGIGPRTTGGPGDERSTVETRALTVLGRTTCEDTAVVADRLRSLGIPFAESDVDVDPAAADRLARLHDGALITPTLVFPPMAPGDAAAARATIVAEPSLDDLDRLLTAAGYDVTSPPVTQFHGDVIDRPVPLRTLTTSRGDPFSLQDLRGRRQAALFLGHDAACLACFGYAKQLARQASALAEADAVAVAALYGEPESFDPWQHEIGADLTIAVDPDGGWKRAILAVLGHPEAEVALVMVDRFGAPRAGSFAREAGGLANPSEAPEWLSFVALDCPECSNELRAPTEPGS